MNQVDFVIQPPFRTTELSVLVKSDTSSERQYTVSKSGHEYFCDCKAFKFGGQKWCKHCRQVADELAGTEYARQAIARIDGEADRLKQLVVKLYSKRMTVDQAQALWARVDALQAIIQELNVRAR